MGGRTRPRIAGSPQSPPSVALRAGAVAWARPLAWTAARRCRLAGRCTGRGERNTGTVEASCRTVGVAGAGCRAATGPAGRVRSSHGRGAGRMPPPVKTCTRLVSGDGLSGGRAGAERRPGSAVSIASNARRLFQALFGRGCGAVGLAIAICGGDRPGRGTGRGERSGACATARPASHMRAATAMVSRPAVMWSHPGSQVYQPARSSGQRCPARPR